MAISKCPRIISLIILSMVCFPFVSDAANHCASGSHRCFVLVTDQLVDWFPAEGICETRFNGFLASIRNAFEKSIVQDVFDGTPSSDVWIGGFRDGDSPFQWSDGASFVYNQFPPGQPSSNGSCIQICRQDESECRTGQWKAVPCAGHNSAFLCEFDSAASESSTSKSFTTSGGAPSSTQSAITQTQTQTSPSNIYPCMRDILILIDISIGLVNFNNFLTQRNFISSTLVSNWTVAVDKLEANAAAYDGIDAHFSELGSFALNNLGELQHAISRAEISYDKSGITTGLKQSTNGAVGGWRPGVKRTTLLFTSTSDPTDVSNAMPYANQLKSNGNLLIVIGLGASANTATLIPLASGPNFIFSSPTYGSLQNNLVLANQINAAVCASAPLKNNV